MAEFYFTAAIANGYEYRNTPDNYRHFNGITRKQRGTDIYFKEIGLELDAKPGEYILKLRIFICPASMQKTVQGNRKH